MFGFSQNKADEPGVDPQVAQLTADLDKTLKDLSRLDVEEMISVVFDEVKSKGDRSEREAVTATMSAGHLREQIAALKLQIASGMIDAAKVQYYAQNGYPKRWNRISLRDSGID